MRNQKYARFRLVGIRFWGADDSRGSRSFALQVRMDFFTGRKIRKLITSYAEAGEPQEEKKLLEELAAFGNPARRQAIEAFQQRRLTTAKARVLLEILCTDSQLPEIVALIADPYDEVRRVAKEMIKKRWPVSASKPLLDQLQGPDLYGRNNAVELLIQLKDPKIVPKLVKLFNDATVETKRGIIKILTSLGGSMAAKLMRRALNDREWQVRLAAVKSLGKLRAPENVEPLLEKLLDPQLKPLALEALAAIGDQKAALPVLALLKDDDLLIRQQATDCLINIADASIVPQLLELMRSQDVNVRRCAVEVLKQLRDPRTAEELLKAVKDSDWWVREIAIASLTELKGDKNIVQAFIAMTRDPDENVRRCAVEFFNAVSDPAAFDPLLERLADEDWWVREKAMRALGALGDDRALGPILNLVDDPTVGWVVPAALGALGSVGAGKEVRKLLLHPNQRVKIEAVKTVAGMAPAEAVPLLQERLRDPDDEVRQEAATALRQLT